LVLVVACTAAILPAFPVRALRPVSVLPLDILAWLLGTLVLAMAGTAAVVLVLAWLLAGILGTVVLAVEVAEEFQRAASSAVPRHVFAQK
jgi:hypothetical protein